MSNVFELSIVFEEELQVLVGNVNVQVSAKLFLKLECSLTTRESILVDFVLD